MSAAPERLISPTQLALFSRSPVIAAWWEEVHAIDPLRAARPQAKTLDSWLMEAGHDHERVLIDRLVAEGKTIAALSGLQGSRDVEATWAAMQAGVDYIHQASLRNEEMRGVADLLERIERPSALGDWSYIPIECKLSSHPKPTYLVQACAYCELLEPMLGHRPEHFKLYLGGSRFEEGVEGYPSARFWGWYQHLRERYRDFRAAFDPTHEPEDAPGDHGPWEPLIQERLEKKRDLILVSNLRQSQRQKLRSAGITTIDELAALPASQAVPRLDPHILERLRQQAAIQVATPADAFRPAHEVFPADQQDRGLAMLPKPDSGDIWFDMEGFPDPISGEKLEYLFGACYRDPAGTLQFQPWWAHDVSQEKDAFSAFVQWVQHRREQYPELHVYHYASYEKTALGNLASRHQIHQALIDQWLREELLVDLYPIVRNGLLVGAPSYSIKKVERLYGDARQQEVDSAADSVVQYAEWRKSAEPPVPGRAPSQSPLLQDLQDYNEKDCQVTEGLHRFLLNLPQMGQITFRANRWGSAEPEEEQTPTAYEKDLEVAARELLKERPNTLDDPDVVGPRGISWRLQKLIAELIDFQERESKVEWWEFFHRLQMSPEEREDDSEVIAAARLEGVEPIKQSFGFRYRFDPDQPLKLTAKEGRDPTFAVIPLDGESGRLQPRAPLTQANGMVWSTVGLLNDSRADLITLKATGDLLAKIVGGTGLELPPQVDLVPIPKQIYKTMLKDLVRLAQGWVFQHKPLPPALLHLLKRRSVPELVPLNQHIRQEPSSTASELAAFLLQADGIGLSLQGPPGTGKTTVTGDLIAELVSSGQRVAVSSTTHEAINHVLGKVQACLDERCSTAVVVKASSGISHPADRRSLAGSGVQALKESDLPERPAVLGGTVFTLVKEAYDGAPFDLLVIDEAGQMSLSNLLYLARVARNILLVGDQQQLSQPNRAAHPGDSGLSCIDYVMAGHAVVPPDRGFFLATSWRMPPPLTQVVSELFYDGQLQAAPANSVNAIAWDGPQQGLVFEPVNHSGNSAMSEEEVEHIAHLVERLHGRPFRRGRLVNGQLETVDGVLGENEILITAPTNMQVNVLQKRLGDRARIGTVDKFQGQEAPVAIHSLTASDADNAPRGLDFLLAPNRINVAISRAQCLSIVVGCPQLAAGLSSSIHSVEQLSRLCRLMQEGQMQLIHPTRNIA